MTDEPTYTLTEARAMIRREECRAYAGHMDLEAITDGAGDVARLICTHCGAAYVPVEPDKAPEPRNAPARPSDDQGETTPSRFAPGGIILTTGPDDLRALPEDVRVHVRGPRYVHRDGRECNLIRAGALYLAAADACTLSDHGTMSLAYRRCADRCAAQIDAAVRRVGRLMAETP